MKGVVLAASGQSQTQKCRLLGTEQLILQKKLTLYWGENEDVKHTIETEVTLQYVWEVKALFI